MKYDIVLVQKRIGLPIRNITSINTEKNISLDIGISG
jgi:hypothetical protein